MRFGSYECSLAFEDRQLDEYATHIREGVGKHGPVLLTAYTLSEVGKPFRLDWRDNGIQDTLLVTVRMDGKLISRGIHAPGTSGRLRGVMTGPRTMKLFTFTPLDPSERLHPFGANSDGLHAEVGTIQVAMVPIRSIKSGPALGPGPVAAGALPVIPNLHYISLLTERIPFDGMPTEGLSEALSLMPGPDIELMERQRVVFEFRYRPLTHLQALGVFPRSPSLTAHPSISDSPPPDSISSMEDSTPHTCTLGKRSRREYEDGSGDGSVL